MTSDPTMSVGMSKRSERGSQMPLKSEAGSTFVMNVIDSPSSDRTMPSEMTMASSAASEEEPPQDPLRPRAAGRDLQVLEAVSGWPVRCHRLVTLPWLVDRGSGRRPGPRDVGPVLDGLGEEEVLGVNRRRRRSAHAARVASSSSAGSCDVADLGDVGDALVGEVEVDPGSDGRVGSRGGSAPGR